MRSSFLHNLPRCASDQFGATIKKSGGKENSTVKSIIEKIQHENSSASESIILARATFLSNEFGGYQLRRDFELGRSYTPAILGFTQTMVTPEVIAVYREQCATLALQILLDSRYPSTITPSTLIA